MKIPPRFILTILGVACVILCSSLAPAIQAVLTGFETSE